MRHESVADGTARTRLAVVDAGLIRSAVVGGLLGGLALFLVMAGYNAHHGMGFWSILNACFAAWIYKNAGMSMMSEPGGNAMPGHETMMGHQMMGHQMMSSGLVASHVTVGAALHLLMSAVSGVVFVLVLAALVRLGGRVAAPLASPVGYVLAGAAGGALLFALMMYAVAPRLNHEIVDFTARLPFFLSHLLFGAVVTGWVYATRAARARHHSPVPTARMA